MNGAEGEPEATLAGLTVAVTGSRRAHELARLIEGLGGRPYLVPTVGINSTPGTALEAADLVRLLLREKVDVVVFLTGPGVYALFDAAKELGLETELREALAGTRTVARSAKPRRALADHGVDTWRTAKDNTAAGVLDLLRAEGLSRGRIAILWHGARSEGFVQGVRADGGTVLETSTYAYSAELTESGAHLLGEMGFDFVPPDPEAIARFVDDLERGRIHAVTFTSPPAVRGLFDSADARGDGERLRRALRGEVVVAAVGPPTRETLAQAGVEADVMPDVYKMGPMVVALGRYVAARGPQERPRADGA